MADRCASFVGAAFGASDSDVDMGDGSRTKSSYGIK